MKFGYAKVKIFGCFSLLLPEQKRFVTMTGTIANATAIILGTLAGVLIRSRLPQKSVFQGIGLFTLAIGISMSLKSANLLLAVLSLVIGGLIGQALNLDRHLRQLTERLQRIAKKETAETQSSSRFTEGLITATMLFCVGSLSILGAIEEGSGETPRLLLTKSIMDGISSIALASSFGICILFSSVPLLIYQGGLTLFAGAMMRFMSGNMIAELTGVGGILLIGLGINILKIKEINIINLLPALIVAVILAYLWPSGI